MDAAALPHYTGIASGRTHEKRGMTLAQHASPSGDETETRQAAGEGSRGTACRLFIRPPCMIKQLRVRYGVREMRPPAPHP
jgi:hypothetical protein